MFTSELPPPPEVNEDGTPSVSYLRYQSTLRLKKKWDSIYAKFQDAHLAPQDELWLGKRMRILKDHGTVRALKEDECAFGSFHIKEEDLDEVERECRRATGEDVDNGTSSTRKEPAEVIEIDSEDDDDEDELGAWDPDFVRSQYKEFQPKKEEDDEGQNPLAGADSDDEEDSRPMDPDLLAFLEAEKKRKEAVGPEEEDEEEEVVDLRGPRYDRPRYDDETSSDDTGSSYSDDGEEDDDDDDEYDTNASSRGATPLDKQQQSRRRPAASTSARTGSNGPATPSRKLARADRYASSGDEMNVLDGVKPNSAQEQDSFRRDMGAKRANVEKLLQMRPKQVRKEDGEQDTSGEVDPDASANDTSVVELELECRLGNSLPYSNVPGLAELLGLPDPVDTADDDMREEMAVEATVFDDDEGNSIFGVAAESSTSTSRAANCFKDASSKKRRGNAGRRATSGTSTSRAPRHSTPPPPTVPQHSMPQQQRQAQHHQQQQQQNTWPAAPPPAPPSEQRYSALPALDITASGAAFIGHRPAPVPSNNMFLDNAAMPAMMERQHSPWEASGSMDRRTASHSPFPVQQPQYQQAQPYQHQQQQQQQPQFPDAGSSFGYPAATDAPADFTNPGYAWPQPSGSLAPPPPPPGPPQGLMPNMPPYQQPEQQQQQYQYPAAPPGPALPADPMSMLSEGDPWQWQPQGHNPAQQPQWPDLGSFGQQQQQQQQ